jgi:hypothetical protein
LSARQLLFRVDDGPREVAGGAAACLLMLQQLLGHGYCPSSKNSLILNEKERASDAYYGDYKTAESYRVFEVISFRARIGDDSRKRLASLGEGLLLLTPRPSGLLIDDKHGDALFSGVKISLYGARACVSARLLGLRNNYKDMAP